jgi:hypothetical protein
LKFMTPSFNCYLLINPVSYTYILITWGSWSSIDIKPSVFIEINYISKIKVQYFLRILKEFLSYITKTLENSFSVYFIRWYIFLFGSQ